jgi:hypothetical protein
LGSLSIKAENIDLSTVPDRDTVQLTIYNAEDLTLVRETRKIVFKPGSNPLQFSWANTLIDPTSVQLRFLTDVDKLDVLDTTFPHDKPQMLYWNVGSEMAGEATVEISYFTSGISWSADYTVIATPEEDAAKVEGFVTVVNNSGEDYPDAEVRLVVGTINLVEQIAVLARQSGQDLLELNDRRRNELRMRAQREMLLEADSLMRLSDGTAAPSASAGFSEAKQVVKKGLSEYFIFTIEGTETIPTGLRKRLPSFAADAVPLDVEYRYRPREYGQHLVRLYLMTNDSEGDLGDSPLPDGQVSIFRQKSSGGLSYLARQTIKYIPIGDEIELNLGQDPDVGFEIDLLHLFRDNIWVRLHNGGVFQRVDQPGFKVDVRAEVRGWDEHKVLERTVRNDTPWPIKVEVRETFGGDATFISQIEAERFDNDTLQYRGDVKPGEEVALRYEVVTSHGRNHKNSRVEIENGDPAELPWE